jgi:hypothetical protein
MAMAAVTYPVAAGDMVTSVIDYKSHIDPRACAPGHPQDWIPNVTVIVPH